MWTLVSDIWNGVGGDAGYTGCMTAVPDIGLPAMQPNLDTKCSYSVQNLVLRGGGPNASLQWGEGSPDTCDVLTTRTRSIHSGHVNTKVPKAQGRAVRLEHGLKGSG
jgi:hypothetical protein